MANTKLPARLLDTSAIPALNVTGDLTVDTTTLKVDSTNNRVGIGVASPGRKLVVSGGSSLSGSIGIDGSATGNQQIAFLQGGTDKAYLTYWDSSDTLALTDGSANGLHFSPSTGKVGIGINVPAQTLHVNGSGASIYLGDNSADTNFIHTGGCLALTADTDVYIVCDSNEISASPAGAGSIIFGGGSSTNTDSNLDFTEAEFGNNGAGRVEYGRFHTNGNFGVGSNNPIAKVHIAESASGQGSINSNFDQLLLESSAHTGMSIFSGTTSDGAIYFGDSGSNDIGQIKYKHGTDELALTQSGTETVLLSNDGAYFKGVDSYTLTINADTDNSDESGVPTIDFKMDGSQTRLKVGVGTDNNPYISTASDIALPLIIKTGTADQNRVFINDTGMTIASEGAADAPDHLLTLKKVGDPVDDRTFITLINGTGTGDTSTPESHIDFEFFDANTNQYPQARISVGTGNYPGQDANTQILEGEGYISLRTNDATNSNATEVDPAPALIARGDGSVQVAFDGTNDRAGYFYAGKDWGATNHRINRNVAQGTMVLVVSAYGGSGIGADTALFMACAAGGRNSAATGFAIEKNSSTNRSINAAGTINASGSDYAEYVKKSDTCGAIAKGDICGIDENSEVTDKWSEAHSFVVKSTDPSYVGGDTWGTLKKPELTRRGYVDIENPAPETKEEYAARKTKYETDLAAFETALEVERVKYDRIAFSGQVPCNLTGASVGDYIIPKEGTSDTITGEAVSSPTFEQYQKAVGKVWKVLDNGNAWISVKIG